MCTCAQGLEITSMASASLCARHRSDPGFLERGGNEITSGVGTCQILVGRGAMYSFLATFLVPSVFLGLCLYLATWL